MRNWPRSCFSMTPRPVMVFACRFAPGTYRYCRKSMMALEESLGKATVRQVKLRFAFNSEKALALYKELEFTVTGISAAKNLGVDG